MQWLQNLPLHTAQCDRSMQVSLVVTFVVQTCPRIVTAAQAASRDYSERVAEDGTADIGSPFLRKVMAAVEDHEGRS